MSIQIDGELHTIMQSLESDHLGQAFDLLIQLKEVSSEQAALGSSVKERRLALSCIIHSFCALESAVNRLGYELFFDPVSEIYVPEEERDFLLNKFIKTWDRGATLEKLHFIAFYAGSRHTAAQLEAKLRELNILRNWLVHGFTYKTTFLLEPSSEGDAGFFTVVDFEESVDWRKKFPNCKFNSLSNLRFEDARKAIVIVLESLEVLSSAFLRPFAYTLTTPRLEFQVLFGPSFEIEEAIARVMCNRQEVAEPDTAADGEGTAAE